MTVYNEKKQLGKKRNQIHIISREQENLYTYLMNVAAKVCMKTDEIKDWASAFL